jgi:hypothetical protein
MHPPLRAFAALLLASCAILSDKDEAARLDADDDGVSWPEDCDDEDPDQGAAPTWHLDADGDGFGGDATVVRCEAPAGGVLIDGDCDDDDAAVHPDAAEACNDQDDNCDGQVDEGLTVTTWYADDDADGFGDPDDTVDGCAAPAGATADAQDCDDSNGDVNPDATERCNGVDDDCDGETDPVDSIDCLDHYADRDGDAFGDSSDMQCLCDATDPYTVLDTTDCDDDDASAYPGATEVCRDGIVNDCDSDWETAAATCAFDEEVALEDADATVVGEAAGDSAGYAIAGGGDVDGDGTDDILIGAHLKSDVGTNAGAAYVVYTPLSGAADLSLTTHAKLVGEVAGDLAGSAVASAGDLDGDGYADILVGAPGRALDDVDRVGALYAVYGPVTGYLDLADAAGRIDGQTAWRHFGQVLAGIGDVDNDGSPDILAGFETGAALIYGPIDADSRFDVIIDEDADGGYAGSGVAGTGDVDGDGIDDFVIGAYGVSTTADYGGAAYLFVDDLREEEPVSGTISAMADTAMLGDVVGLSAGWTVAGPGDVDGDGRADILIGTNPAGFNEIAAYLITEPTAGTIGAQAEAVFRAESPEESLGSAVAGAGDVNGDGNQDVLIGVSDHGDGAGATYLMLGPISGSIDLGPDSDVKFTGTSAGDHSGSAVAAAGHTDSDAYDDFLIGASGVDGLTGSVNGTGAAYLIRGIGP